MRTIKVFIASSEELHLERLEFTDMVVQLNKAFRLRGLEIEPVKWEWLDSSMTSERKQTEYNNALKKCEICIVMYWNKRGEYTEEELNIAYNEQKVGNNPKKLYVYFKEPATEISTDLEEFKTNFSTKYGHFYCKFENVDTFRLNFLLQFEQYQNNSLSDSVKMEIKDSKIIVAETPFVNLKNIPFAGNNPDFLRIQDDIQGVTSEIKTLEMILSTSSNKAIEKLLEKKRTDLNELAKELINLELSLLDTAKLIVKLQYSVSSTRLAKAIELFEKGDNKGANAVLDFNEICSELVENSKNIDNARKIRNEATELETSSTTALYQNIEELKLKIKTLTNEKSKGWFLKCDKIYGEAIIHARGRVKDDFMYDLLSNATLFILQNINLKDKEELHSLYLLFMEKKASMFKSFTGAIPLVQWMKGIIQRYRHHVKIENEKYVPLPANIKEFPDLREEEIEKIKLKIIETCLPSLNEKYSLIIRRLYIDHKPKESIAKELNVSMATFYCIQYRAIGQLKILASKLLMKEEK